MEQIKHLKKGKLIIFNIEIQRNGSQKDVEVLTSTFQSLNAEVENHKNCSKADVKRIMGDVKEADLSKYDYVVIVVGAHGSEDSIAETANKEYIYLIKTFLIPMFKNKTLSGKLKWLITQTCRGDQDLTTEGTPKKIQFYDPRYYLISHSTTEGFASRRSLEYGSLFIGCLCKELQEHYQYSDILTILRRTSDAVEFQVHKIANVRQKPTNEDNFGETFSFAFFS